MSAPVVACPRSVRDELVEAKRWFDENTPIGVTSAVRRALALLDAEQPTAVAP